MELVCFEFPVDVEWKGGLSGKEGEVTVNEKHRINVATPPEFRGPDGFISPEHLYVASAAVCLMSTFLTMSRKVGAKWTSYRNHAVGILQQQKSKNFLFTEICVDVHITIPGEKEVDRVKRALELAKKHCLITNSMKAAVEINLHTVVEK